LKNEIPNIDGWKNEVPATDGWKMSSNELNEKVKHLPLVVAHRGASYAAPENTLPSFLLAFEEDADFIEGDFWLTKDNQIVCLHDKYTIRTAPKQKNLNVKKSTMNEILKLDFGKWKDNKYLSTEIITLEKLLNIIPHGKGIFIEIKDTRQIFMFELQNVLKRTRFPHSLIRIIAFDSNVIKKSKQLFPDIKAYWLFDWLLTDKCKNMQSVVNKLISTLKMINADGIDMNYSPRITGEIIYKVKHEGYEIIFYDVNTPKEAQTLAELGVDAITTNFPGKIKASIK